MLTFYCAPESRLNALFLRSLTWQIGLPQRFHKAHIHYSPVSKLHLRFCSNFLIVDTWNLSNIHEM